MEKAKELNSKFFHEAVEGLEKGFNKLDFEVMSQALDNMKDIAKIKKYDNINDIEGTEIDDNLRNMLKHFEHYVSNKKEYQKSYSEIGKAKCIESLNNLMYDMHKIMEELKTSSDFEQERDIIKTKLREMFSLYN